jgi:hypothetical protein
LPINNPDVVIINSRGFIFKSSNWALLMRYTEIWLRSTLDFNL